VRGFQIARVLVFVTRDAPIAADVLDVGLGIQPNACCFLRVYVVNDQQQQNDRCDKMELHESASAWIRIGAIKTGILRLTASRRRLCFRPKFACGFV
jgi:hypothetical protein